MCKDCFTCYCKIPTYCKFCNSLLMNEILLSQLKESKSNEDYENKFNNLQEIVVFFYYERLNENKFDHIFYKFLQKINSLLGHFQKKESKFF